MKNKICMICKMTVLKGEEEYVTVAHYGRTEELLSKGHYHLNCYRDRLNNVSTLSKLQEEALSFIRGAKKKTGIEEEVVII